MVEKDKQYNADVCAKATIFPVRSKSRQWNRLPLKMRNTLKVTISQFQKLIKKGEMKQHTEKYTQIKNIANINSILILLYTNSAVVLFKTREVINLS